MGLIELFEIGFFTAFWNWSNPILTAAIYFCVAVGVIFQLVLQKKCSKPSMRWSMIVLFALGIIISECAWQVITGWDRLVIDIIYGLITCLLLGAIITAVGLHFKNKQKQSASDAGPKE